MEKLIHVRLRHLATGEIISCQFKTQQQYEIFMKALVYGQEGYEIQDSKIVDSKMIGGPIEVPEAKNKT